MKKGARTPLLSPFYDATCPMSAYCRTTGLDLGLQGARSCGNKTQGSSVVREKLKVPPRPFPLEELSHYNHSGQLQVFFTQLEPNSHGVRQSSHVSVETNSNKRISVLGTNHTKIYRVNLVGFKHSAEDPSRSPHHQNKYTLRSKRFSNVLSNHQGRFPETVPEAKTLTNRGTYHKRLTLMILHPPHFAEGFLKDLRRDQQKTNTGSSALGGCPGHIPLVRTRHSSTRNTTQRRSLIKKGVQILRTLRS